MASASSIVEYARPQIVDAYKQVVPRILSFGAATIAPILARIILEIVLRLAAPYAVPVISAILAAFGSLLQAEFVEVLKASLSLFAAKADALHPISRSILERDRPDLIDVSRFQDSSATAFHFMPPAGGGPAPGPAPTGPDDGAL